jgi:hypothetical protein
MNKIITTFSFLLVSFSAIAHPVIYQGGWALNSTNFADYSNNYVMYSMNHRFAVGVDHWRFSQGDDNTEAGLFKVNNLLWRYNGEDAQANIYLHGGAGVVDQEWGKRGTHGVYMGGIDVDWETRQLYTAFKHYQFYSPNRWDSYVTQARVGYSPYTAEFDKLQTWVMLQAMVVDDIHKTVQLTPMVRFFYHNVLWEVGSSTRGDWMLNLMVHL